MRAMQIVEFGKPLKLNTYDNPKPQGSEVLVRIGSSGVCHSDLHIWEGFFDLGMGKKLEVISRGMKLPHTLGHEIAGEVAGTLRSTASPRFRSKSSTPRFYARRSTSSARAGTSYPSVKGPTTPPRRDSASSG